MPTLEGSMDNKEKITKSISDSMKVHQIQNISLYKVEGKKKKRETSIEPLPQRNTGQAKLQIIYNYRIQCTYLEY